MLVTFEPLLRFYFYKMLDRSELNFLLIDHLSTCLPVTTRQREPTGDFAKNGSHWHYLLRRSQTQGVKTQFKKKFFLLGPYLVHSIPFLLDLFFSTTSVSFSSISSSSRQFFTFFSLLQHLLVFSALPYLAMFSALLIFFLLFTSYFTFFVILNQGFLFSSVFFYLLFHLCFCCQAQLNLQLQLQLELSIALFSSNTPTRPKKQ